jgi:Family of unknown function (DUF6687)
LEFLYYHNELPNKGSIMVDGCQAADLVLSNLPGTPTPAALRADTSVETVLRYISQSKAELSQYGIVSNDHFDCGGLLSVWAMLNPERAQKHYERLVDAAHTSDFEVLTSQHALKFNLIVKAWADSQRSPIREQLTGLTQREEGQLLYDTLLARMPGLLYDQDEFQDLWEQEYAMISGQLDLIRQHQVRVAEYNATGLSVLHSPVPLYRLVRHTACRGGRILNFLQKDGRNLTIFEYNYKSWFDLPSYEHPRIDLQELAEHLTRQESHNGLTWKADQTTSMDCTCSCYSLSGKPATSSIPPLRLIDLIKVYLMRGDTQRSK